MLNNERKIVVNFLYQFGYQLLVVIVPLITAPYISRVLGAVNTGIYTYTYSVAVYFMIFSSLGIDTYGNRCVAKAKACNREELNKVFSGILFAHLAVSIFVIIAYCIYVFLSESEYKRIALMQGLWLLSATFDINWFFFGLEKFKITVTRNLIIKILSVCMIFLFVRSPDDLWIYTMIMAGSAFASQVVLWGFVFRYVQICKVPLREIIRHLSSLFALFIAVVATSIYIMIDKVMIGWTDDMAILGNYEYADKIIRLVISLITALGTVMLPRMTALYSKHEDGKAKYYLNMSSEFIFIVTCAMGFGLAGIAEEFVPLFLGDGYEPSVLIIKILCISMPVMGWNNLVRTQILIPNMRDRIYTTAVWAGAIVDILLNIVLIPVFSAYGAAVATVLAYLVVGLFQTIPIFREFAVGECFKSFVSSLLIGVIMFFVVRFVSILNAPPFLLLVLQILAGIVVYITLQVIYMIISDDDILKYIRQMIKQQAI